MTRLRSVRLRRALLPLVLPLLISCQYAGDRGLDFLDQFQTVVGAGTSIGVRARSLGLVDTGLMIGIQPRAAALGWSYGIPLYFNEKDPGIDGNQAVIVMASSQLDMDYTKGSYKSGRNSAAILPALFTWTDSTPTDYAWYVPEEGTDYEDRFWLWSAETTENNRYAQIHAFDIELEFGLIVYVKSGYSPGETLDFILGLFTIDIAKDDGRL